MTAPGPSRAELLAQAFAKELRLQAQICRTLNSEHLGRQSELSPQAIGGASGGRVDLVALPANTQDAKSDERQDKAKDGYCGGRQALKKAVHAGDVRFISFDSSTLELRLSVGLGLKATIRTLL